MMETGAHAIGCTVFPGGVGNTELQLQAMAELRPQAYAGTPSFLRIALEKADELGLALPSLTKASVGGEAFPPALRDVLAARGVHAYQSYGTADVGLIAYETAAREGLVLDEGVIVEIVRPGTGEPVPGRRGRRGRRHRAQPRLPAGALRHRRPVGGAARPLPHRPHAHPHPRLAGPRRPDGQGARHVRAPQPGGRGAEAPPRARPRAAGDRRRDGQRPHDAARRSRSPPAEAWRRPWRRPCAT